MTHRHRSLASSRRSLALGLGLVTALGVLVGTSGLAYADRVDDLSGKLRNDSNYKVRLTAAVGLGKLGDPRAVGALLAGLGDGNKSVRAVSAAALGTVVSDRVTRPERDQVALALRRASSDGDPLVRSQAQKSLASLKVLFEAPPPKRGMVYVEVGPMSDSTKRGGAPLLQAMRKAVAGQIDKKGDLKTAWPSGKSPTQADLTREGARGAFYVDGTLVSMDVKKSGGSADVSCNMSLIVASFPEKSMFGFVKGGAAVQTGASAKDIEEGKIDCVVAVLEDLTASKVVPTIVSRVP